MNQFAEKMEEFLKEAASDAVKDQIRDAIDDLQSEVESQIDDVRYSTEQAIDSAISDVRDDVTSEVMSSIETAVEDCLSSQSMQVLDTIAQNVYEMIDLKGAINECLNDYTSMKAPLISEDTRWIKDYIDAIIKERISIILNELVKFAKPSFIPNS